MSLIPGLCVQKATLPHHKHNYTDRISPHVVVGSEAFRLRTVTQQPQFSAGGGPDLSLEDANYLLQRLFPTIASTGLDVLSKSAQRLERPGRPTCRQPKRSGGRAVEDFRRVKR